MEYKSSAIIQQARTELHKIIEKFIIDIYLKLTDGVQPNFAEDEEYELEDIEFTYNETVFDTYTDEYYTESRTANGIRCALDGMVYLTWDNDEKDINELSTDELNSLAVDLEIRLSKIK